MGHALRICIFARGTRKSSGYAPQPLDLVGQLLADLGHSVTLLTGAMAPIDPNESDAPNFRVRFLTGLPENSTGDAYWRRSAQMFDELFDQEGPFDLVIGRGTTVWGFLRYSRHAETVPVLLHEGTYPRWLFGIESRAGLLSGALVAVLAPLYALRHRQLSFCLRRARRVICLVPALGMALRRAHWWHPPKTVALAYGVDTTRYHLVPPNPLAPPRLVFLGRMTLNKGIVAMIEVLSKLKNRTAVLEAMGPTTREVLATVQNHSAQRGVADRYSAPGPVQHEDVPGRLAGATAFVFPSTHAEGLPKVLLEAMACGVPIVAYRQRVLDGLVKDGVTGFLVPIRSIRAMAARVDQLLDDPALQARMAAAARRKIETDFAPDAIRAQWQALLAEVMAEAQARRRG